MIDYTDDRTINAVIDSIIKRSAAGRLKYGTTMFDNPLGIFFWIDSAIEELTDAAAYLQRLKEGLLGDEKNTED